MPLVNVYNNYGKSPFLMGKLTISMAIIFQFATMLQESIPPTSTRFPGYPPRQAGA
jgi:hypothetical protein